MWKPVAQVAPYVTVVGIGLQTVYVVIFEWTYDDAMPFDLCLNHVCFAL